MFQFSEVKIDNAGIRRFTQSVSGGWIRSECTCYLYSVT